MGEGHSIIYITPPRGFHHKTLKELGLRNKYGVNLIALRRTVALQAEPDAPTTTTATVVVPDADTTILPSDVLVLVGSNESLSHLPRD